MSNVIATALRRQRDRLESERLPEHSDDEEGSFIGQSQTEDDDVEAGQPPPEDDHEEEEEQENEEGISRFNIRPTMSLAELEEEREMARRRSASCVLFALFILFRLWIMALEEGDIGLLLLCLVGTSWTIRWIKYNRDQEAELDRRISSYLENDNNETIGREDLRMLSFQAQLALAIMESQRQMMQGGHGHPDGEQQNPGVSDASKAHWKHFEYKESRDNTDDLRRDSYGSVGLDDKEEEPHCSICLGEYENGEKLTKLPCSHIYHGECIHSWTTSHTRCPLCNLELETEAQDVEAAQ